MNNIENERDTLLSLLREERERSDSLAAEFRKQDSVVSMFCQIMANVDEEEKRSDMFRTLYQIVK